MSIFDLQLGSCLRENIAARVLTRIIGHFPGKRNQMIIDAGFTALSQQGYEELGKTMAIIKVRFDFDPKIDAILETALFYFAQSEVQVTVLKIAFRPVNTQFLV